MVTVYFAGQDNFGNRGCEALIRSNVKTIRGIWPDAKFLVPSHHMALDRQQWPQAEAMGVEFVPTEPFPTTVRWWGRLRRVFGFLSGVVPRFQVSKATRTLIERSDVVVMTGGDIISLDYGLESLYYWAGICEAAMNAGKPTVLWAASVGPFTRDPATERNMKKFLSRFSLITVRETPSYQYLKALGIGGVAQVTDPAFVLDPEPVSLGELQSLFSDRQVLGFNISPLILKFRDSTQGKEELEREVIQFLSHVSTDLDMNVLLVPHVDPLDGGQDNSDWVYMKKIISLMPSDLVASGRIRLLQRGMNAAQLKWIIGRCSYFMGARTHATVAALSQGVPTTSIAYSIKAKGINEDLFGHLDYVLETPSVSVATLKDHFSLLVRNREAITESIGGCITEWRSRAAISAQSLASRI